MQRLEVSGAVRPIYGSLGVKRLKRTGLPLRIHFGPLVCDKAYSCCRLKNSGNILGSAASECTEIGLAESSKHWAVLTKTSHKTKHTITEYKS